MSLTRLEITSRAVYFDGQSFGEAGPYERIEGVAHFAVDPAHQANAEIVDLALAERGSGGLVHFEADVRILQPVDPTRRQRRLLFDVLNRGGTPALGVFNNTVPLLAPTDVIQAGNGHLFRHGWTVAWCGWQWDVPRGTPGMLGLTAPQALEDGRPMAGQVCVEVVRNTWAASVRLCDQLGIAEFTPYCAADVDEPGARMTVQDWPDGPRTEIPRGRWRFVREEGGRVIPDDACAWLDGGFQPGRVYDIFYTTRISPVVGCGLLSARDFTSFLRHTSAEAGNPCAGSIEHTHAFGVSQSGRFLRTFLYHGLNVDEAGRRVFDGVNAHVAGARRGEFNHRHAQPSVEVTPGFGHLPPHDDARLLARQRAAGSVPKVMYTNSSAEYWRGDAALSHVTLHGSADLACDEDVRHYLLAGTQHTTGMWPLAWTSPIPDGPRLANWLNSVDQRPLMRAALANLDAWVAEDIEPPPSAVPSIENGTAIGRAEANASFGCIPGAAVADAFRMRFIQDVDLGPRAAKASAHGPPRLAAPAQRWSRRSTRTATKWRGCGRWSCASRSRPTPAGTRAIRASEPGISWLGTWARHSRSHPRKRIGRLPGTRAPPSPSAIRTARRTRRRFARQLVTSY